MSVPVRNLGENEPDLSEGLANLSIASELIESALPLPETSEEFKIPPRQRRDVKDAADTRATVPELQASLEYYQKARLKYLQSEASVRHLLGYPEETDGMEIKVERLANGQTVVVKRTRKADREDDPFLIFIDGIIDVIKMLLGKTEFDFDYSQSSMVKELDLDESFFIINLHKVQEGGELYRFFMTVGRFLAEYRMMETYRVCDTESRDMFRRYYFKQFSNFLDEIDWYGLYEALGAEIPGFNHYTEEMSAYRDVLFQVRANEMDTEEWRTKHPLPTKPRTPFRDDIYKASVDRNISQTYFLDEIMDLASKSLTGKDAIKYMVEDGDINDLWESLVRDLHTLQIVYNSSPYPEMYIELRQRIERFRGLFFELLPDEPDEDGSPGHRLKPTASQRKEELRRILQLENEDEMMEELESFIMIPEELGEENYEETHEEPATEANASEWSHEGDSINVLQSQSGQSSD